MKTYTNAEVAALYDLDFLTGAFDLDNAEFEDPDIAWAVRQLVFLDLRWTIAHHKLREALRAAGHPPAGDV